MIIKYNKKCNKDILYLYIICISAVALSFHTIYAHFDYLSISDLASIAETYLGHISAFSSPAGQFLYLNLFYQNITQ